MLVLLIVLVVLMFAGLPSWGYNTRLGLGWYPSGLLGVILLVVLLYMLVNAGVVHRI